MISSTIQYTTQRDCFITIKYSQARKKKDLQVFEISNDVGEKSYVSSRSRETTASNSQADGILQINQLYANKLGLKDGEVVIIREVPSISTCHRVNVEPVSVDDWEILERHAGSLESGLLNQIRVVWAGQTLPVWVGAKTCIFITIVSTEPSADCVMLREETEVIVAPKLRKRRTSPVPVEAPVKQSVSSTVDAPFIRDSAVVGRVSGGDSVDSMEPPFVPSLNDFRMRDLDENETGRDRQKPSREKTSVDATNIQSHWSHLMSVISKSLLWSKPQSSSSDEDDGDSVDQSDLSMVPSGLNAILRVQPLRYDPRLELEDAEKMSVSSSPRKNSSFSQENVPQQPSTVYIDMSDIEAQLKINRNDIPKVFIAKLRRLPSPKEQQQAAHVKKTNKTEEKESPESPRESPRSQEVVTPEVDQMCVVRVIVIDRRRQLTDNRYINVVQRVLRDQPLLPGHMIIPDMLRRFLKLDVSSRVWLQTMKGGLSHASAFSIYPLGNVPKKVTNDMMMMAFKKWLESVSNEDFPLVVFQGLFVKFPVFKDIFIEAQITYNDGQPSRASMSHGVFSYLHPGTLRSATLGLVSGSRVHELTHPAIKPMLAYISVASFDPLVPKLDMKQLGGVSQIIKEALSHLEVCFATRPLYQTIFQSTPGLMNGMLLLTGAKGSGKSCVAKALCRTVAELPNLAHTVILECKPLRGKKVDNIQKAFELVFDEAAWRQPALIVFDDLDHLAGSPAGPEFEMSGEALYAARVAEVVKDLLRKDIRNMSRVAVLATSQSRSSLHPILVASRGTHLVQEVVHIGTPNKNQRKDILNTVMQTRFTLSDSTFDTLDWDQLVRRTEGFVARDLTNIVNRAVHARLLAMGMAGGVTESELDLTPSDFEFALDGFTPASIRNVPLHQAGELGWDDIGGLTEVKNVLVETLQWPTKYPQLFSNCPLRLRSGLLLYGAPGTGKTLLAGVVAKECGLNFISIKGPELLSKYIGASEQAVRDTFSRAQSAKPCILFFDEFDSIAPRRGHDNTGVTDRVVNQLLTQLDGVEGLDGVYVLAATSRPDLIDPALLRPGRLDKCLHCPLPNQEERWKILEALSRKMIMSQDVDLKYFAENCEDYTGADFKALLYNAQLEAIHELTGSEEDRRRKSGRYGMKSRSDPVLRLKDKSRQNHKLSAKVMSRERSWSRGKYAYIPSLEEGVQEVSGELEEKLSVQVSQIRLRERRNSEHVPAEEVDSPLAGSKLLRVNHNHLLSAFNKMRASVSGDERAKYQRIYENFVSSRGGNFNTGYVQQGALKATLA